MSICELVWKDKTPCKNEAVKRIKIILHSGIYAGLYEVENRYKFYNVCQEHYNLVKNERNVVTI